MNISDLRREYTRQGLRHHDLDAEPVRQFAVWFENARDAGITDPNAMSLATVAADGQPSLRTVLLKFFDQRGLVFFTNLESNKAREIAGNPRVALAFLWRDLERQVIVKGTVSRVSNAESLRYFVSRPHGSQLGAWVSQQSNIISGRKMLEMKLEEIKRKFAAGQVPLPSFWGGYRVAPASFEFWQGRPNRLHDRFLYSRADGATSWEINRLAP